MKSSWIGIGFSHHRVPSLSNTATRSSAGTGSDPSSPQVCQTKSTIACRAGPARQLRRTSSFTTPPGCGRSLTRHRDLYVGLAVGDQVTGDVDSDAIDGAAEGERVGVVVGCDAAAAVVTAGEPLGAEDVRHGVRHVDRTNKLFIDVQLAAGRHSFSSRKVGLSGRLQFVA